MAKYTDEQIKKMLGTIIKQNEHKVLNGIPNNICCLNMELTKAMRDLINRQEAEIERLNDVVQRLQYHSRNLCILEKMQINRIKSNSIIEFVSRLKNIVVSKYEYTDIRVFEEIDNLVKEMEGENDG